MPGGGVRLSVGRGWRVTPTPLGISGGVNPGRWGERASLARREHTQHSYSTAAAAAARSSRQSADDCRY